MIFVGIGNEHRCDDGVGLYFARELRRVNPRLRVHEISDDATLFLELLEPSEEFVVVDAMKSGCPPGTLQDLNADSLEGGEYFYSTHSISFIEILTLARILGRLPEKCTIHGVEGKLFETGTELSPEVRNAADLLVHFYSSL